MKKIRIVIVDDHSIFRNGLKAIFEDQEDMEVISEAENGFEFLKILHEMKPDIILMDIKLPEMNGMEATRKALKIYPDLKIIALSMFENSEYLRDMIDAGASGYLLKDVEKEVLIKVINNVFRNDAQYYAPNLLKSLSANTRTVGQNEGIGENNYNLSPREIEVLRLIAKGYSNNEIGERLFISPRTVGGHRNNLLSKMGVKNTASMIGLAIESKLI